MIDFCFIAVLLVIPRWWFGGDFFCCQGEDVGCHSGSSGSSGSSGTSGVGTSGTSGTSKKSNRIVNAE